MKCIKLCSIQHRDLALKYEKIRIGTNNYFASITEPVLRDDEEKTKKFTLRGPVELKLKELKNIGANILCDVRAGNFVWSSDMADYFVFSCTSIDGGIRKRAKLLNKDAGYKITDSSKFSKLVMDTLSQHLRKDNKIPSPKYHFGVFGPIQYNDDVFQSKPEFFSKVNTIRENPPALDWALRKSKSHAGEKEHRFIWMFADKFNQTTKEAHMLNLPYDYVDLKIPGLKNIIKRINF